MSIVSDVHRADHRRQVTCSVLALLLWAAVGLAMLAEVV